MKRCPFSLLVYHILFFLLILFLYPKLTPPLHPPNSKIFATPDRPDVYTHIKLIPVFESFGGLQYGNFEPIKNYASISKLFNVSYPSPHSTIHKDATLWPNNELARDEIGRYSKVCLINVRKLTTNGKFSRHLFYHTNISITYNQRIYFYDVFFRPRSLFITCSLHLRRFL